jgi:hypothetical protein
LLGRLAALDMATALDLVCKTPLRTGVEPPFADASAWGAWDYARNRSVTASELPVRDLGFVAKLVRDGVLVPDGDDGPRVER